MEELLELRELPKLTEKIIVEKFYKNFYGGN